MKNTKITKHSMLESFDVQGEWWVPGIEKSNGSIGSLYSDKGVYYLNIVGSLLDNDFEITKLDYIHGFTVKGEEVTLINCYPENNKINWPGIPQQTFIISSFLVGGQFEDIEKTLFWNVNFSSTYLTQWFSNYTFRRKKIKDNNKVIGHSASVIMPEIDKYYLDCIKSEIRNHGYFKNTGDYVENVNYLYNESFFITPDSYKSFYWFKDKIFEINNLLSLFINKPMYFKKVIFEGDYENIGDKQVRKEYQLYLSQKNFIEYKKMNSNKMLFTYKDLKIEFTSILNNWFNGKPSLKIVYNLYLSNLYNSNQVIETKFLNAIQTLEVYHRTLDKEEEFSDSHKQEYLRIISDAIEGKIPDEIKKRVIENLEYFNKYSLGKRLRDILKSLDNDTVSYLFKNRKNAKDFFHRAVLTRNDLTHNGRSKKDKTFKGIEKFYAFKLLRVLSLILLFKELGINESLTLDAICKSHDLSFMISDSKENLGLM